MGFAARRRLWKVFRILALGKTQQDYELESPEGDPLLDALSLLEIHGDEAREGLAEARTGLSRLFPYFFKKKEAPATLPLSPSTSILKKTLDSNFAKKLIFDNYTSTPHPSDAFPASSYSKKTPDAEGLAEDFSGSFLDTAAEDQRVEARSNALLKLALEYGSNFWATPERTRQIVRFQDRAIQVRDFLDFCTRTLSLVYSTMFPRNKMPETLPALMEKFRDAPRIHGFVRAQLTAGARFAMMMIQICYPKLDMSRIVAKCLAKMAKRKRNVGKIDDIVTPVAEEMMDELLRMDAEFFVKGSYAEHSTRATNNEQLTIDDILGSE
ncbi:hypothetical protein QYE76_003896 [Lolium multiflorum]|uniref:Uncharacterized protein n=1 Tax=Lolium multiflorum TaxID=4521 RepID=A0AAD8W205_LOLMU|nr:hypothetical protein QYE76_003896 [Lolium multiflorum]